MPAGGSPWIVRLAESAVADVRTVAGAAEFLEGAMPGVTVVGGLGLLISVFFLAQARDRTVVRDRRTDPYA